MITMLQTLLETLLEVARWARWNLYQLTRARVLGIDVDLVLHFGFGALLFAFAQRRWGTNRAAWFIASLILAKEIADLFLKSQLRYISRPTPEVILDIVTDVATGGVGALFVWFVRRLRRGRCAQEPT